MNYEDIVDLKCNTADLLELLRSSNMGDELESLPFRFDLESPPWIAECEYIGTLNTNDLENAGIDALLLSVLVRLLAAGRLYVQPGDLPESGDDWEGSTGKRPVQPDATDMHHASHRSLSPCPHCGGSPITFGEINVRTGIYVYRCECSNQTGETPCMASTFGSSRVKHEARDSAIEKWERRAATDFETKAKAAIGVLIQALDTKDADSINGAIEVMKGLV